MRGSARLVGCLSGTALLVALGVAGSGTANAAVTQHAQPRHPKAKPETPEHALVHWINVDRASAGLRSVAVSNDLTAIAHQHASSMAKSDRVFHDATLGSDVQGWESLAEDVGSASRLIDLEHAFLSNPDDRVNIRGAGFRQIGVGVSIRAGLLYVTVIMRQPDGTSPG